MNGTALLPVFAGYLFLLLVVKATGLLRGFF